MAIAAAWGCGSSDAEDGRKHLRVSLSRYFANAPLLIAREEGFFADEGLDVEFVDHVGSASQLAPALAQGRVDVVASGVTTGILNAIGHGERIRLVADRGSYTPHGCSSSAVVARRGLLEPGRELGAEDVRGRRFATSSPSSGSVYVIEALLDSLGLTLEDVETDYVPSVGQLDALNNGAVDFVPAIEPHLTKLVAAGHRIAMPDERILPGFHSGAIMFGRRPLEDRDAGRRFARAYLRAVRQYNEGKTERNVEVLSRATRLDPATVRAICWPPLRADGRIDVESIVAFQEWSHRKGYLDEVLPGDRFWDPEFVDSAAGDVEGAP